MKKIVQQVQVKETLADKVVNSDAFSACLKSSQEGKENCCLPRKLLLNLFEHSTFLTTLEVTWISCLTAVTKPTTYCCRVYWAGKEKRSFRAFLWARSR